jgi:hypothetical protein
VRWQLDGSRRALREERKLLQVLDSLDIAVGRQLRHLLTCRHAGRLGR